MPLAERLADLFSPERFEDWSWSLADAIGLGDFFYSRSIPPQILLIAILIILGVGVFVIMPEPEFYCGDGICSGDESYFNCKNDCEKPEREKVTVSIEEDVANETYTVEAYNSEGISAGVKTAGPSEEVSFNVGGGGGTVQVTSPRGQQWVAGIARPGPDDNIGDIRDGDGRQPGGGQPGEGEQGQEDNDREQDGGTGESDEGEQDGANEDGDGEQGEETGDDEEVTDEPEWELSFPDDFESPGDGNIEQEIISLGVDVCLTGYLAPGTTLQEAYLAYLETILSSMEETGTPPEGTDASCADLNGDSYITIEDRLCFSGSVDNEYASLEECPDCFPWESGEICNDGLDNDCDGQTDRDTYDNRGEESYTLDGSVVDLCDCNEITPCGYTYSRLGLPMPTAEANISRCSSINGGEYQWHNYLEWECTRDKAGDTLVCNGRRFNCTNETGNWFWNGTNCHAYPDMEWTCEVCDGNGICDGIENYTICPEDCPSPALRALIALIEEAKPSNNAINQTIEIMAGEAINKEMLLSDFSGMSNLTFDCSGNICLEGNMDIKKEELLPLEDLYFSANASCEGGASGFECEILVGDPVLSPELSLSLLVGDALENGQASKGIAFEEGDTVAMEQVSERFSTVDYLDLDCSSDVCTQENFQLSGDSFTVVANIMTTVEATCDLLPNGDYGCRLIL